MAPAPFSEAKLWDLINAAEARMNSQQARLWETIRILPERWRLHRWGDEIGGFWVVALLGRTVVWYNEIEDGFNRSSYTLHGTIDEYCCNQDRLEATVQQVLAIIETGYDIGGRYGPPRPGKY